jgi:hypothetical protein
MMIKRRAGRRSAVFLPILHIEIDASLTGSLRDPGICVQVNNKEIWLLLAVG